MGTLEALLEARRPEWEALAVLVARAKGRPERLGPDGLLRLARLYRSASTDLVTLRGRIPGDPEVDRLTAIVAAGGRLVYADPEPRRRGGLVDFFSRRFWRLIRERPVPLLLSVGLLLVPGILAAVWGWLDPTSAAHYAPGTIEAVTQHRPHGADLGIATATQSTFATSIFTHNIVVALLGFAGGLTGGLLTAYLLVTNGLELGVFTGLAGGAHQTSIFVQLTVPHGLLELSCVTIAGTVGFRLAAALIDPGERSRGAALASEALPAFELVAGAAAWLVVAGCVEGFVTPAGIGLGPDLLIGIGLFVVFWGLVLVRGGRVPSTADRPRRTTG